MEASGDTVPTVHTPVPTSAVVAEIDPTVCDDIVLRPSSSATSLSEGTSAGRRGLTFGVFHPPGAPTSALTSYCHGAPGFSASNSSCNPYLGDTPCDAARPILCIRRDGLAEPGGGVVWGYYSRWSGGVLATTAPHLGTELTSRRAGDAICAAELGDGFVMSEFHDGTGWGVPGYNCGVDESVRHWMAINDQRANCWD